MLFIKLFSIMLTLIIYLGIFAFVLVLTSILLLGKIIYINVLSNLLLTILVGGFLIIDGVCVNPENYYEKLISEL